MRRMGDGACHPGPQGRGYQRPRPMNRPDPPRRVPVSAPRPPLVAPVGRETHRPPVKPVLSPARPFTADRPRNPLKRWQLYKTLDFSVVPGMSREYLGGMARTARASVGGLATADGGVFGPGGCLAAPRPSPQGGEKVECTHCP
jgi:hypothetical protein